MAQKLLHHLPAIQTGIDKLCHTDPVFKGYDFDLENFLWPYMGPGFESLVRIIIGQQLSVKAAASLWARFKAEAPAITPPAVLSLSETQLASLGLSRQKQSYITGLARAVAAGDFNTEALPDLSESEVSARITALKGMGPWSARMYLIFGLARPDIWAPDDLGIREGMRRYLSLENRPTAKDVISMGDRFAPHRTAASLLLWRLAS